MRTARSVISRPENALPAAAAVGPDGHVLGVDIANNLLALARAKAADQGLAFRVAGRHPLDTETGAAEVVFGPADLVVAETLGQAEGIAVKGAGFRPLPDEKPYRIELHGHALSYLNSDRPAPMKTVPVRRLRMRTARSVISRPENALPARA